MNNSILGVLGIPLEIYFEGVFDVDVQADALKRIEEKTFFRLKEDMDVDGLVSGIIKDTNSTMDTLRNAIGKGLFGERFRFMDEVIVVVCPERISVDEMSKHCVPIDEIMGENVEEVFKRIISLEGEARIKRQRGRWSFKSLADIFKSNPEEDKRLADGLFLMQRYKEAYKVYSRYNDTGEFSQYCIEMSVYCLVLSKKPVPSNLINSLGMVGAKSIRLVRMMAITMGTKNTVALEILSLLDPESLFKAFAQESLAQALDKKYSRKRIEMWFYSALRFYDSGHLDRSVRCCEYFLNLADSTLLKASLSTLARGGLVYSSKYIRRVLKSMEEGSRMSTEDMISKEDEGIVAIRREWQGSACNFQGVLNVSESIFLECKRRGFVSISNAEDKTVKVYHTGESIPFDGPGKFYINYVTFNIDGIDQKVNMGIPLDIREDALFMHLEMKDVCEVFCGELYFLLCKVIRNHRSSIRVYFDNKEFTTDKDMFSFEIFFPSVGVYIRRVIIEASGCIAYKDVKFTVVPSFSIDIFNYKHCLPLLFLKVESYTVEGSKLRSLSVLNNNLEVASVEVISPSSSYKDYAVEYLIRNIVGTNDGLSELPKVMKEEPPSYKGLQKVLQAMDRSPPVISDLLFSDLMPRMKNEIVLPGRRTCSICVFLQGKKGLKELLKLKNETFNKMEISMVDKTLLSGSKLRTRPESSGTADNFSIGDFLGVPIRVEIEVSPKRICIFMLDGALKTLFSKQKDYGCISRSKNPFVYITHFSSVRVNEPTIIYLCISNYYEYHVLNVKISSETIAVCREDSTFNVEELSFSLFEIRCVFKERKKYGSDDIGLSIKIGSEEINYEWLVELPSVL
ncbi:hypothetical protein EROM_031210 [Encephalitozoon romaleae SJ-2008]|uniref:Uncharacterized protein n=1 Tax=Encephalitozoon romaleae (strain SJ-2008) TaxID=1178016 RepID=I6ZHS0_ENCRO|nr:hypothetical protein EROM_031210 [Encephalitozoon romaleae SJ-2008]AFN82743.1 hypothetical protein EROM_031210 [Encephalitozoon romaleae SJ-2008]